MPSGQPKCAHCRIGEMVDAVVGYRCRRCRLFTNVDGSPARPAVCAVCSGDVVYDADDRYTCIGRKVGKDIFHPCARTGWGPFPIEPMTMVDEPPDGFVANEAGVHRGKASTAMFSTTVGPQPAAT